MGPLLLAALLVLVAATAYWLSQRPLTRAVDLFPGPPAWPVIGNVNDLIALKFNMTKALEYWTAQYGGVYRIWLGSNPFIILSKPGDLEILLSSTKHIEKNILYDQMHTWVGRGLLTSFGHKWSIRRKLITPTFHFKILDQFMDVFNKNSDILVKKLLSTKDIVNVHSIITLSTLDIICETAMGTSVEAYKNATSPYVSAVHDAVISFYKRTMKPWLYFDLMYNMSAEGRSFNRALRVLHHYTREVIESRKKERMSMKNNQAVKQVDDDLGIKKREAFLDHLLDANDSGAAALEDKDIREEVDTFMFEGHDTTAAAITFILYNVAAHPEVQEKMVAELRDIFGDSDRAATSQDVQSMRYTERVVKESLRLYPSVPIFGRIIREDLPITDGYVIPAGANVTVDCFGMHRNPALWPEPERFDPDRFLTDNAAGRHPYAYIPFSAGPRNCIGQKFAMMEMKSSVSKVVRHCVLELPHPGYTPLIEGQAILRAPEGVLLKISPRQ